MMDHPSPPPPERRPPSPTISINSSTTSSSQREGSASRILHQLLSIPTNRSCAECRSTLVDSSQIQISFSPSLGMEHHTNLSKSSSLSSSTATEIEGNNNSQHDNNDTSSSIQSAAVRSFQFHHDYFAPPTVKEQNEKSGQQRPTAHQKKIESTDPATRAMQLTGGHGVFLCHACGSAHKSLGSNIAMVRSVQDKSAWTPKRLDFLTMAGGNARSWAVLEAYIPETWQTRRPTNKSTMVERETFCRAKYQVLAFLIPPHGPLGSDAWLRLLSKKQNRYLERWNDANSLGHIDRLTIQRRADALDASEGHGRVLPLPNRLVDYFCVIGHGNQLSTGFDHSTVPTLFSPDQLSLEPTLLDCYPDVDAYGELDFPEHVSKFVFPDGVHPLETRAAPKFFTFVLTTSSGVKLYGAALHIYNETMETEELFDVLDESDYDGALPPFLIDENQSSDIVFLPKCLVVISHYPFFHAWRSFLIQLYRISLVESPLPIERYIVNFVSEVPLPPQGKLEIKCGFTAESQWSISRPPPNQHPIADFSYRPLFAALSAENIMVVIGCLLEETPVALSCNHYSLLTPVAEALLSLLFPFEWQGIYLPIMPLSMADILEAPVPFLVGLHGDYLAKRQPSHRPHGVVFVDLDSDVVHLGFDGDDIRRTPALPEKEAAKLKAKLEQFGSMAYIVPELRQKEDGITTGHGELLPNVERQPYAHKNYFYSTAQGVVRSKAFAKADEAFWDDEILMPMSAFSSEQGQLATNQTLSPNSETENGSKMKRIGFRKKSKSTSVTATKEETSRDTSSSGHMLDIRESNGFSSKEIRNAFLRFFVTIFRNYEKFVVEDESGANMFRREDFLNEYNFYFALNTVQHDYLTRILDSQMFQRFLDVRQSNPYDADVLFFNESIVEKNNRSMKKSFTSGKRATPFLDDRTSDITETFIPTPPSNWGLPDDGRLYSYTSGFPKLDQNLMGKVRTPKQFAQKGKSTRLIHKPSSSVLSEQRKVFAKAMKPLTPISQMASAIGHGAMTKVRDVEWAIFALSHRNASVPKPLIAKKKSSKGSKKSSRSSGQDSGSIRSLGHESDVSHAQDLIISARRKQGILLDQIIKIQATIRMFLVLIQLEDGGWRKPPSNDDDKYTVSETQDDEFEFVDTNAVVIQSKLRAMHTRKKFLRARYAVSVIQGYSRANQARKQFLAQKAGTIRLQALFRGRRARFIFASLQSLLSKAQALVRGFLTRQKVCRLMEERRSGYRAQMVELWHRTFTPLSYRSKFWLLVSNDGFLHLNLLEEELSRLWSELATTISGSESSREVSPRRLVLNNAESIGMSNRLYQRFLEVEEILSSVEQQQQGSNTATIPLFPAEKSLSSSTHHHHLEDAFDRVQREKMQMYEKLNSFDDKDALQNLYRKFDISPKEKEKKVHLIEAIWRRYDYAEESASVMMVIFPELTTETTDIYWMKPSKKAAKRFNVKGGVLVAQPLPKSMCVHTKLEARANLTMRALARANLGGSKVVKKAANDDATASLRQRKAIIEANGYASWIQCRYILILNFLYLSS